MPSWFARAQARIPGGVNSPVRAFGSVGGKPFFVARAHGAYLVDTEGGEYLDYVQSWGASILGHADPAVVEAVQRAAAEGTSFGAPTTREVELAEAICDRVASVDKVRLVSSGTEAAMTAVRLARGRRAVRRAVGGGALHRLDDDGMGVPEDRRAPRLHVVEVAVAVGVEQVRALGAFDEERFAADRRERTHR